MDKIVKDSVSFISKLKPGLGSESISTSELNGCGLQSNEMLTECQVCPERSGSTCILFTNGIPSKMSAKITVYQPAIF